MKQAEDKFLGLFSFAGKESIRSAAGLHEKKQREYPYGVFLHYRNALFYNVKNLPEIRQV